MAERTVMTLCLVHEHPRILLGMKKRGFGAGRWNGFGGKVVPGESVEDAARRELREESGIIADELQQCGRIEFSFSGKPGILDMHVFRVASYSGEPQETEEMRPQWFHLDEIPFADMWPDDAIWMPLFFLKKKFQGAVFFDDADRVVRHTIAPVETFTA